MTAAESINEMRELVQAAKQAEGERYGKESKGSGGNGADGEELEVAGWPSLAENALYGLAGRFVELASRKSEADPAATLSTFLVWFGVECGPDVYLEVGDSKHPPRLNAVVVGASSKARKGTSAAPVKRLRNGNSSWTPAPFSPGPFSSGEGIIFRVRDEVKKWEPPGKKEDTGRWVVIDPGETDKRLFVLDEEFASALKVMQREGNTLSMIIRRFFDDGNVETITKVRNKTTGAHVGWVSHITVSELHRLLAETETLNGFANRILWTCARRQGVIPSPEPMPDNELAVLRMDLIEAVKKARTRGRMGLSAEAKSKWEKLYPMLSADKPGMVGRVTSRAEVMVLRLALVFALLDSTEEIGLEHINAAKAVWDYCETSARFIFGSAEINPHTKTLLNALRQKKSMTLTEVWALFERNATKKQIEKAISGLVAGGLVRVEKGNSTGGKRPTILSLNEKHESTKKPG